MLEFTTIQSTAKPDRAAEPKRTEPVTAKEKAADKNAEFEREYDAQSKAEPQKAPAQESAPKKEAAEQSAETDKEQTPDTELVEGEEKDRLELVDPEALGTTEPIEKPKLTKATSENAFGERLSKTDSLLIGDTTTKADPVSPDAKATEPGNATRQVGRTDPIPDAHAAPETKAAMRPAPEVDKMAIKTDKTSQRADVATVATRAPESSGTQIKAGGFSTQQTFVAAVRASAHESGETRSEERRNRIAAAPANITTGNSDAPKRPTIELTPPQPIASSAASSLAATQQGETFELSAVASAEGDAHVPWDSRPATSAQMHTILNRPETPSVIGRQLAEAVQRFPDRPVELALNPEELGRVRMSISASDTGIVVNVLAERPETLDLMRRHIDQLAREFQSIGYGNISFSFAEGQSEQTADGGDGGSTMTGSQSKGNDEPNPEDASITPITLAGTSGLDMRL